MDGLKSENLFQLSHTLAASLFEDCVYPWEVLDKITEFILNTGPALPLHQYKEIGENVWVADSAVIAPNAYIHGPCIIAPEAQIRHCAFIRGSAVIGRGAVVGNSTEIKNAILFDRAQVPHYNYIGDSVLGYQAHMGAGAVTSNVKGNKTLVTVHFKEIDLPTGRKKFGAMLGDYTEIGCGSVLNPGVIIGRNTQVYPLSSVRGCLPPDSIYKTDGTIIRKR